MKFVQIDSNMDDRKTWEWVQKMGEINYFAVWNNKFGKFLKSIQNTKWNRPNGIILLYIVDKFSYSQATSKNNNVSPLLIANFNNKLFWMQNYTRTIQQTQIFTRTQNEYPLAKIEAGHTESRTDQICSHAQYQL